MSGDLTPLGGDPAGIEEAMTRYRRLTENLAFASAELRQVANTDIYISRQLDLRREDAALTAGAMALMHVRYAGALQALLGYASELRSAQAEAASAIGEQDRIDDALRSASARRDAQEELVRAGGPDSATAAAALGAAEGELEELALQSRWVRRRYDAAIDRRDAAARRAGELLEDAAESSRLDDTPFLDFAGHLPSYVQLVETMSMVVEGVIDAMKKVSEVLGAVSLLLVMLLPIPVVGQVAGILFGVIKIAQSALSIVPILWTMGLVFYGTKTWRDVAAEAIGGAISILGGALVKKLARPLLNQSLLGLQTSVNGLPAAAAGNLTRYEFVLSSRALIEEGGDFAVDSTGQELDQLLADLIPDDDLDARSSPFPTTRAYEAPDTPEFDRVLLSAPTSVAEVDAAIAGFESPAPTEFPMIRRMTGAW